MATKRQFCRGRQGSRFRPKRAPGATMAAGLAAWPGLRRLARVATSGMRPRGVGGEESRPMAKGALIINLLINSAIATCRDLRFPRISAGARSRLPFSWIDSDPRESGIDRVRGRRDCRGSGLGRDRDGSPDRRVPVIERWRRCSRDFELKDAPFEPPREAAPRPVSRRLRPPRPVAFARLEPAESEHGARATNRARHASSEISVAKSLDKTRTKV